MIENETFQLDYERYSISNNLKELVKEFNIKSVLEAPAPGLKAMPSIYSLGFGEVGCDVTLLNSHLDGIKAWKELKFKVHTSKSKSLTKMPFNDNSFDFVWNFNTLSQYENYDEILDEFIRVSKKYVCLLAVNGFNVGSPLHRILHVINDVHWTHGDRLFLYPFAVKNLLKKHNLKIVKVGVMNCPIWPDSVGFRDMKFHKMEDKLKNLKWHSNTIDYVKNNSYPWWFKHMYYFEKMPMIWPVKLLYAHLFYVIGEKQ
ncbi:methyltransferase domain-containing protein [Candidatus Woesearchaeota archaeon]|nr:MAG: hypothetical protein QT09_C0004G0012 [archaeon GW2011_AR18]MBS3161671.1 methyltransferase domain-containing protein [Candidatus Woesearchaeota archaeon]HIH26007.1 class I SAM-dependent methyltransferase [Nanoarchaeota archaeon]